MTVKECYEAMGADYDDVMGRLRKDERVQKFLGVCQNLSITTLYKSSSELAERLRDATEYSEDMEPMIEEVKKDYAHMIECIRQLA